MKLLAAAFALALVASVSYSLPQELPKTPEEAVEKVNELLASVKNVNISSLSLQNLTTSALKNLNITSLPINEAENVLRNKCTKNGGDYETAKKAAGTLFQCTKDLVNFAQLKEEMDKARPTGDLDEVFGKYCKKKPTLLKCMNDFATSVEPCLEPIEKENKQIVQNITEKILNFVCFKDGDRIALFVAAKGPECFQNKATSIAQCVNSTYGSYKEQVPFNPAEGLAGLTSKLAEIKELPTLVFDEKACRNMQSLQTCSVQHLEGCSDPTPANLMDSIFNYIKKVTPCDKFSKA